MEHKAAIREFLRKLLVRKNDCPPFSDDTSLLLSGRLQSVDAVALAVFWKRSSVWILPRWVLTRKKWTWSTRSPAWWKNPRTPAANHSGIATNTQEGLTLSFLEVIVERSSHASVTPFRCVSPSDSCGYVWLAYSPIAKRGTSPRNSPAPAN